MMERPLVSLDITTARLFIATVECGSIALAARSEAIAPSALSKRIQLLEAEAGAQLLIRHRRGVEATGAGMLVLRRAHAILREISSLRMELDAAISGMTGRVVVTANEAALMTFLPLALSGFITEHPGVEIALEERANRAVVQAIWQNAADIGIFVGEVPPLDLWRCPLFRDRLVLVLYPGHPLLDQRTTARMIDILNYRIVGQATQGVLWRLLSHAAATHNRILKAQVYADGYDSVCSIVANRMAIGIVSESAARIFAPAMGLVSMPIVDEWASREHQLCARSLNQLAPAARALLNHLIRTSDMTTV